MAVWHPLHSSRGRKWGQRQLRGPPHYRRKDASRSMKFFIDTADIAEIRDLAATGMVDGITTNPSLVAKSGSDFFEVLKAICDIDPGPVSAEATPVDFQGMLNEGRALAKIGRAHV